ncbi:hypothetical protein [Burkholderia gladioli]|uniref:hypothetical protein n=1 Tax=Burkholderia gladioli TaxID=28095 RepID=UPI00163FBBA1|nr:hypothetical protein [Burkholderia gladioli]
MAPERYRAIVSEFDFLIAHAVSISHHLTGRPIDGRHMPYVDTIFTKLICHGISLRKLSPSTDVPRGAEIWDLPSACAVGRALIETYDAMGYIGAVNISDAEREFRVLMWELHDQKRRLAMLERIRSADPQVESIRAKGDSLAKQIANHPFYANASDTIRNRVARGEACHLTHRELNVANGIDHGYCETVIMFLSQYVHSLPLSLHQLMHLRAGQPEALQLSSMPLQYAMPFIAKAIERMTAIWPDSEGIRSDELRLLLEQWLAVATNGVARSDD